MHLASMPMHSVTGRLQKALRVPAVISAFGRWVVGPNGEIDRAKLGRLVFSDPEALAQLEAIIHPLVLQAVDWMVQRSNKKVIVIEAIKLFESNLNEVCDSNWVVYSPPEVQLARLMQKRGMQRDRSSPADRGSIAAKEKDGRGKCGDPQRRLI